MMHLAMSHIPGKMAADNNSLNNASFMAEIRHYECLYNKFSQYYKNKNARENAWGKICEKFKISAAEAEKKYKNIRTSYGRYLKKLKNIPSGSGRDAVPSPGEYANLDWLRPHIAHRSSTTNLTQVDSEDEENSADPLDDAEVEDEQNTDSPISCDNEGSANSTEVEVAPTQKRPSATSTPASSTNTKRPWATANRRKSSPKEEIDLAMIQIAEKLLKEPTEKQPRVEEDDEELHFAKSLAKRVKKLPERAKGYVRLQIEQLMYQVEFGATAQQHPATMNSLHMGYNQSEVYQPQYHHHSGNVADYTPNLQQL